MNLLKCYYLSSILDTQHCIFMPFELKFKQKIDIPTFNYATDKEHEKVTQKETKGYNLHHSI